MATKALLAELAARYGADTTTTAAGGIDVARRVRAGEKMDVVVLAAAVMRALAAEGFLVPGSLRSIALSSIAIAVRTGTPIPSLPDEAALRQTLLAAPSIGYSTGPSGDHLLSLIDGWNLRTTLAPRLVQAPPGVPVGQLLASGQVSLGFQQRSELMAMPGVTIAGPLPPGLGGDTEFVAGIAAASTRHEAGCAFIAFLASPATEQAKRHHGLAPP